MARRSDHSREELYDLALSTAAEIVERDGYRALTARTVADAIGYSPGTLYNLFANLDDLIVHLNAKTLDDLHDRLSRERMTGEVDDDLKTMLGVYLGYLNAHPELWNLLFEFSLPDGVERPVWYQRKVERALGLLEGALRPAFPDRSGAECKAATRVLWAGLHGICSLATSGKLMVISDQSVDDMAQSLVTHYLAGLRAKGGKR